VRSATEHAAAFNSLKIAGLAVLGSLLFAVPATIGMSRMRKGTVGAIEPLLLSPLVLPSLVYGLAALIVANFVGFQPSLWLTVTGHVVV
ncbi:ABC transporter permease, partial [Pseudomonas sp. SIMBA_077]